MKLFIAPNSAVTFDSAMGYTKIKHNPTENQSVGFFLTPKNGLPCQPRVNRFSKLYILIDTTSENIYQTPFIFPLR